ncbi:MAG TPA: hypothetical protein VKZ76_04660 [Edaphocola sp.]|nr:hypothetical protein [Edaphocola sp.]
MRRIYLTLSMVLGVMAEVAAQPVSAFVNFQNQFIAWDNGVERRIESLIPRKYDIGRYAVPYIDNTSNFKIYSKGGVQVINQGFTSDFTVTDNLVAYRNANALWVWENGKSTNLSPNVANYVVGDSVVLFFDNVRSIYKAYYGGNIYEIEGFLGATKVFDIDTSLIHDGLSIANGQLPSVKVSDNMAAFVNYANRFKIFYHGQMIEQETYAVTSFDVGRNLVAYVDASNTFKVFHNGQTYEPESFAPQSYKAGDNVAAYVSNDGYFKIFYEGEALEVGYFVPEEYRVADNIVSFRDPGGYFKVFYKGRVYTLDAFYPKNGYTSSYNSLVYVNSAGMLRMFCDGDVYDVTSASVAEWRLDYDVLQYRFGSNMYKIFYKGKTW